MELQFFYDIYKFNQERKLLDTEFDPYKELSFIYEEISEGLRKYKNIHDVLDALGDIVVFSIGSLYKMTQHNPDYLIKLITTLLQYEHRLFDPNLPQFHSYDNIEDMELQDFIIIAETLDISHESFSLVLNHFVQILNTQVHHVLEITGIPKIFTDQTSETVRALDYFLSTQAFLSISNLVDLAFKHAYGIHTHKEYQFVYQTVVSAMILNSLAWIEIIGFNSSCVMSEITKHILSRKGRINLKTGKWEKFKNQKDIYQPDFNLCKRSPFK